MANYKTEESTDHESTLDIQKRCRKDKEEYISNICQDIESHSHRNDTKNLFQTVELLTTEHGTVFGDIEAILNVWQKYCT